MNVIFSAGDSISLYTSTGAGGTTVRATISCSAGGITGATHHYQLEQFPIYQLAQRQQLALVELLLNPVLNFGLVQGIQGPVGATGPRRTKEAKAIKEIREMEL
jgi:hypothetical protein